MEDYEYKVIKSHATQSQNSSKSTSNISKFTSKSTSKTNQIKVRGAMGGADPPHEPLPGLYSPPKRGCHGSPRAPSRLLAETTRLLAETIG